MGLSCGASAVRAVRIKKTDTGYAIVDAVSMEYPPDREPNPTEMVSAVEQTGQKLGREKRRLVAGLPTTDAGIHFFEMPFDRPEKVAKVLRYEAEPLFLTPVDEMLLDYIPLPPSEENGNIGLVFGAKPESVGSLLENLSEAGLEPNAILPDRLGLLWAGKYFFNDPEEPLTRVLLDLGHKQTGLAIFRGARPVAVRSIYYGGRNITASLAKTLDLDWAEADQLKRGIDLSGEESEEREALVKAYQPLLSEIQRTLAGSFSNIGEDGPLVVLGGGGAAAPGLRPMLEGVLGLEIQPVSAYYSGPPGRVPFSPELVTPFGLALLGVNSGYQPNLRQGDFAPSQVFHRHKGTLIFMAALLLFLLLFKVGDLVYSLQVEKQRYLQAKTEVESLFKQTVPGGTRVVAPLIQLRQEVERAGGVATSLGSKGRVLDILMEISRLTSKYEKLRITDMALNPEMIELQGEGPSYEVIDRFKTELSNLAYFSETNLGGAKMDPTTKVLTFKISMKRKTG